MSANNKKKQDATNLSETQRANTNQQQPQPYNQAGTFAYQQPYSQNPVQYYNPNRQAAQAGHPEGAQAYREEMARQEEERSRNAFPRGRYTNESVPQSPFLSQKQPQQSQPFGNTMRNPNLQFSQPSSTDPKIYQQPQQHEYTMSNANLWVPPSAFQHPNTFQHTSAPGYPPNNPPAPPTWMRDTVEGVAAPYESNVQHPSYQQQGLQQHTQQNPEQQHQPSIGNHQLYKPYQDFALTKDEYKIDMHAFEYDDQSGFFTLRNLERFTEHVRKITKEYTCPMRIIYPESFQRKDFETLSWEGPPENRGAAHQEMPYKDSLLLDEFDKIFSDPKKYPPIKRIIGLDLGLVEVNTEPVLHFIPAGHWGGAVRHGTFSRIITAIMTAYKNNHMADLANVLEVFYQDTDDVKSQYGQEIASYQNVILPYSSTVTLLVVALSGRHPYLSMFADAGIRLDKPPAGLIGVGKFRGDTMKTFFANQADLSRLREVVEKGKYSYCSWDPLPFKDRERKNTSRERPRRLGIILRQDGDPTTTSTPPAPLHLRHGSGVAYGVAYGGDSSRIPQSSYQTATTTPPANQPDYEGDDVRETVERLDQSGGEPSGEQYYSGILRRSFPVSSEGERSFRAGMNSFLESSNRSSDRGKSQEVRAAIEQHDNKLKEQWNEVFSPLLEGQEYTVDWDAINSFEIDATTELQHQSQGGDENTKRKATSSAPSNRPSPAEPNQASSAREYPRGRPKDVRSQDRSRSRSRSKAPTGKGKAPKKKRTG